MKHTFKAAAAACALVLAGHAAAQVTFYEGEGYRGRAFTANGVVGDFSRSGFNDRASSVVVDRGRWEVCEDAGFRGRCVVLRRGSYDSLQDLGIDNRISSVRPVNNQRRYDNEREPAAAAPAYEYRRRPNEQVYAVPVTSVRAVVGAPNQRCWIERQQVPVQQSNNNNNVGGALIGGLIGGVLGHQVGGGTGKDIATAAGAVGGAVVGSNLAGRNGQPATVIENRDVQRCENTASTTPEYWDVTYNYRGVEHRVQMGAAPGPTIIVNANGEPRM